MNIRVKSTPTESCMVEVPVGGMFQFFRETQQRICMRLDNGRYVVLATGRTEGISDIYDKVVYKLRQVNDLEVEYDV